MNLSENDRSNWVRNFLLKCVLVNEKPISWTQSFLLGMGVAQTDQPWAVLAHVAKGIDGFPELFST